MAGTKGNGHKKAKKNYYTSYQYEKNRTKKLQKLLKEQPNNDQVKQALKNIHHRGPKPSKSKYGWVNKFETLVGYVSDKKKDLSNLYSDLTGPADAKARAWMAAHVRKTERQRIHEANYATKKERAKGTAKKQNFRSIVSN